MLVWSDTGVEISLYNVLNADDTLVLCGVEESQLRYLRVILHLFEMAFGSKINLGKASFVFINEVNNISWLGSVLSCQIGDLPIEYLERLGGKPARYKAKQVWLKTEKQFEMRLVLWKR